MKRLVEVFKENQIVYLNNIRLTVGCVDHDSVWLTNLKTTVEFKRGTEDFNKIEIAEPLLERDVDLNILENITKSNNQKFPVLCKEGRDIIIERLDSTNVSDSSKIESDLENNIFSLELENFIKKSYYSNLPSEFIAKSIYSSIYSNNDRGRFLENHNPTVYITDKIQSSYWRYGFHQENWNQLVDSYNKLKSFKIDKEDFDIRLDTTTGRNEKGYSRFNRTYIDGVFSYVLYYKTKPVLNIGFSFSRNTKGENVIQIAQIQCIKQKGNRWIFKFGADYVEQIVTKLYNHFKSTHRVLFMRSEFQINELLNGYLNRCKVAKDEIKKLEKRKESGVQIFDSDYNDEVKRYKTSLEKLDFFKEKGIPSIEKTLGIKFNNLKRLRYNNKFNYLVEK